MVTDARALTGSKDVTLGRNFRLYAVGRAVSVVGDRVAVIALVFLVIHLSHASAAAVGFYYFCSVAPTVAVGVFAGLIADHFDRRRLMIACDVGRAVLLTLVPAFAALTLWTLYPLVVGVFTFTVLFDTAVNAALPDVVPEPLMLRANSILRSIDTAGDLAYAVGGVLVFALKLTVPFYLDAATFLFSATLVATMRIPSRETHALAGVREAFARIREGVSHLVGNPFLKWSTVTFAVAPLAGGIGFVLTPLYANRSLAHSMGLFGPLRNPAVRFSVLEVALGAGALIGATLAARVARTWPRGRIFGVGMSGFGLSYVLLGFTTNVYVAAALVMANGLFNSMFVVSGLTLTQVLTPSDVRGRVVAARMAVINASLAVGTAVGGIFLIVFSYSAAWILLGVVIVLASLFVWIPEAVRDQP